MSRMRRASGLAFIAFFVVAAGGSAQGTDLSLTSTPANQPIVVPSDGGSFGYRLDARNGGATSQIFDVRTVFGLPGGRTSDTAYGPVEIELPGGGWSARNDLTEYLPGNMPSGTYSNTAFAGPWPDLVWASDSFTLEKLPAGSGWYGQSTGASYGLTAVWFVDASNGWAVSSYREILHSATGGDTWQPQDDGQIYPHQYSDVQFVDAQTGWVVGHGYSLGGTILHTVDGGETWVEQDHPYSYALYGMSFVDASTGWVVGGFFDTFGSDHRRIIEHTADGGETWIGQYWESFVYPLEAVHFVDAMNGWAVGGPGGILHTSNGGASWHEQGAGTTSYLADVFFIDAARGWCVGNGGALLQTTNGGQNWEVRELGAAADLKGLTFVDPLNGWIVGVDLSTYRPIILHTSDGGMTWQPQDPGTGEAQISLADVCLVDASIGWAVGEQFFDIPVLLHTEDGGGATAAVPLFVDGFESGDTATWSATMP